MIENLELYRTFYHVASSGSFTAAAERLFISQSAVSQAIKKLETDLGCLLFARRRIPVELTEEGEILLKSVEMAFQAIAQGEQHLRQRKELKKLEINLGATESVLYYGLPEKIAQLQSQYPNLKVNLCGSTTQELLTMLHNGSLAAAFVIMPPDMLKSQTNLRIQRITQIQDYPVVSSHLELDTEKVYNMQELSHIPLIASSKSSSIYQMLAQWFAENGCEFSPQYTVSSTAEVLKMVECSLGMGILPARLVKAKCENGELALLRTTQLPKPRELVLAIRPEAQATVLEEFAMIW